MRSCTVFLLFLLLFICQNAHAESFSVRDGGQIVHLPGGGNNWRETPPRQNRCCVYNFVRVFNAAFGPLNTEFLLYDRSRNIYLHLPLPSGTAMVSLGGGSLHPWEYVTYHK